MHISIRSIALCIILFFAPYVHAIKFEASDITNPLQTLASLLLPLILTYDAATAPDLTEIHEYATPDIQYMCTRWKDGKKPYKVREACEDFNDALYEIHRYDKEQISYLIGDISRAYGKQRPASTKAMVTDFNKHMKAIKQELSHESHT